MASPSAGIFANSPLDARLAFSSLSLGALARDLHPAGAGADHVAPLRHLLRRQPRLARVLEVVVQRRRRVRQHLVEEVDVVVHHLHRPVAGHVLGVAGRRRLVLLLEHLLLAPRRRDDQYE
jgi:hypothetical protein